MHVMMCVCVCVCVCVSVYLCVPVYAYMYRCVCVWCVYQYHNGYTDYKYRLCVAGGWVERLACHSVNTIGMYY